MSYNRLLGGVAGAALAIVCVAEAQAQTTTGAMRGRVVDTNGAPVTGAAVIVQDVRTNTLQQISTDNSGTFSARGLRVGGPYTVTASAAGFGTKQVDDLFINLGDTLAVTVSLEEPSVDTIVVSASAIDAVDVALGPSNVFSLSDLQTSPAINRDIKDVLRLDPRVYIDEAFQDGIQCAGANPRSNLFALDGVSLQDSFGLNSNGYPTERIPFSFDAVEQTAVEFAPIDVQYGGFTGCAINNVSKTGSNELHGGFFFDYTDDTLTGGSLEGADVNVAEFDEIRYGVNLGGPIIKDKVFFFAAYERLEGANTFDRGPEGSGAVQEVAGFTQEEFDEILRISQDVYNYDPGFTPLSFGNEDEKLLAKVDWNITNNQRASFTYIYNDGFNITESDGDANEFEFSNHLYERGAELTSYVGSLFSDWTDNFSTELRIGYSELDNRQISVGGTQFAEIIVQDDDRNRIYLGGDDSRQANNLDYDVLKFVARGFYQAGNHSITAGFEREEVDIFNLFVQHLQGQIEFNSIEFFEAGIFDDYDYANSPTLDVNNAAADWAYAVNTFYAQDEWAMNDFTFTAGLRYDLYTSGDSPPENPGFVADYGFSNAENLDGKGLLQPRFGVQWDATNALTLRAGLGRYSGGNPNVWLSNNYSNNNVTQFTVNEGDLRDLGLYIDDVTTVFDLTYVDAEEGTPGGPGWGVPVELRDLVEAGQGGNFEINVLDPDFEVPSEWKLTLGASYLADVPLGGPLGGEYFLTGDIIVSRGQDSAGIQRLDLVEAEPAVNGLLPQFDSPLTDAFVLTNIDGTEAFNLTVSASKSYDFGLDWTLGYSYTDAKDEQPMTSAVAFSNFNNRAFVNPNGDGVSQSNYNIPHRLTFNSTYEQSFFGDLATRFGVTGIVNQGRPFSYTFIDSNNLFGFTPFLSDGNVLLYVPTGVDDPNVVFGDDFDTEAFFDFVNETGLDEFAGGFADRNAFDSDWWVKFDLKVEQEFPGLRSGDRSAAFFVIDNVGNLLNDEWGVLNESTFPRNVSVVDAGLSDDGSQFVFNDFAPGTAQSRVGNASLWSIRFGVRYEF